MRRVPRVLNLACLRAPPRPATVTAAAMATSGLGAADAARAMTSNVRKHPTKTAGDAAAFINDALNANRVVVWSQSWCPHSANVKKSLERHGVGYAAVELDEFADAQVSLRDP
jgi:hypothetical protein